APAAAANGPMPAAGLWAAAGAIVALCLFSLRSTAVACMRLQARDPGEAAAIGVPAASLQTALAALGGAALGIGAVLLDPLLWSTAADPVSARLTTALAVVAVAVTAGGASLAGHVLLALPILILAPMAAVLVPGLIDATLPLAVLGLLASWLLRRHDGGRSGA
ncbi:MAG: hypothetical protein KDE35_10970, partial [Geminicoccaceae bacterium]|nr:hypothetical protein [Geminicoccaceae bacterium]